MGNMIIVYEYQINDGNSRNNNKMFDSETSVKYLFVVLSLVLNLNT